MSTLLRLPAVTERIGLSKTTIYDLIKKGEFPRPISLGARSVAWVSDEIDVYISERIKASRADENSPAAQAA